MDSPNPVMEASTPAIKTANLVAGIINSKFFLPVIIFLLVQALVWLGTFNRLEMSIYDSWFWLSGAQEPGDQVVVVAIDEASIKQIGPLAWPRTVHAQLLDRLAEAKAVAFDITFGAERQADEDMAFAEAIAEHGRVVLASKFYFERDEDGDMAQVFEPPIPVLLQATQGLGFVNTPSDPDQVVRRISLVDVNTFENFCFPSLGLAAALMAQDLNPADIKIVPGYLIIADKMIPISPINQALPKFWGPRQTFTTVSYGDIISGKTDPQFFHDKIVLIGYSTQEEHDVYPTPFTTSNMMLKGSPPTPGVEIHASVVQSFLSNLWFKQLPPLVNLVFLLLVILLTAWAVAGRGPGKGLLGTVLVLIVVAVTAHLAWRSYYWLNSGAPLIGVILTYTGVTGYDFLSAEMARRKTRAMFSRYVSASVVEELLTNPDDISLGGKKQVVTIMFADIRGFTAYSENKDPENVISRLNEYLTAMTDIIFRYGGTLDKYLGDGLMAFFGAPIYFADHVERAIKVAVEMQTAVENLNEKWVALGEVPLKVAVGINTGPAVVGNVGSPERMDYTLIGEDVNLASRVEALSKLFETLIVVSERSYNMLPEGEFKDSLYYLGEELVKGFTNPIACYSVKGLDLHFERSKDKGFK